MAIGHLIAGAANEALYACQGLNRNPPPWASYPLVPKPFAPSGAVFGRSLAPLLQGGYGAVAVGRHWTAQRPSRRACGSATPSFVTDHSAGGRQARSSARRGPRPLRAAGRDAEGKMNPHPPRLRSPLVAAGRGHQAHAAGPAPPDPALRALRAPRPAGRRARPLSAQARAARVSDGSSALGGHGRASQVGSPRRGLGPGCGAPPALPPVPRARPQRAAHGERRRRGARAGEESGGAERKGSGQSAAGRGRRQRGWGPRPRAGEAAAPILAKCSQLRVFH